jgi:hypothetical protein
VASQWSKNRYFAGVPLNSPTNLKSRPVRHNVANAFALIGRLLAKRTAQAGEEF